jgi:hypothetical protein
MKPIIHLLIKDYLLSEELKKLFKNNDNVIINNDNILELSLKNTLYVSLTCCLLSSFIEINKIYLDKFKHNELLQQKLNLVLHYTNTKELYIPYHSDIYINLQDNHILYIPIKYSIYSNISINHIYQAFQKIYNIYTKTNINYIIIPLYNILHNSIILSEKNDQYIATNIYNAYNFYFNYS